ncbi:MAG: AAA family ATPase [Oscillatoriaceae cyanobacterium Prado104]|jgi:predicted ATPase/signal transduction histidine kinase|nr:AAA family ATPase [Oscillatoriaceae cyanobacterium Prado104]
MNEYIVALLGYQILEQIYAGTRTLVYRAVRESDARSVVVKLLRNEFPSFSELVQFRNQYAIAKNLDLPGIVRPLSLEAHRNGYALVMSDFGGISLPEYLAAKAGSRSRLPANSPGQNSVELPLTDLQLCLDEFFPVAIQIVSILEGLIRCRVIHKDIKPANILINPDTKEVKLIDFSIASLLPRETQTLTSPNVLEGTLAYLSPEQTGRMNRGIDYRSDFYSLGVTFFELLTGILPFQGADAMELVHCHIAEKPPAASRVNSEIPPVLSAIISKLMAKNAEDRYQSALGLKWDLETCWQQWQATGNIAAFELGKRDVSDRFIIPEKLYGRETEVAALLAAFDRVASPKENRIASPSKNRISRVSRSQALPGNADPEAEPLVSREAEPPGMRSQAEPENEGDEGEGGGKSELMLVAGFSGIGKTSVVNEVHKPIVRQRGYFIKGKFDQFGRNIPFSAFVQAFRGLMGQLLTESDAQIQQWQSKILAALGDRGQVIVDVIPELERLIGKQPPVEELFGTAAQNRFNFTLQKFIQVFANADHPLVIFLDDLQWADAASLNLIQLLAIDSETRYLLQIGAYRDNEVSAAHPLMLTLGEIQKVGAKVNTITLAPLERNDLNCLIADTLVCDRQIAAPLTELVHRKTQGNPFFATQFLKYLHEEGSIDFNLDCGYWQCDIAQIKLLAVSDDVVEFIADRLKKLPRSTQQILQIAACIGNQFDLTTLAVVCEKSQVAAAADLWKALQEELIVPENLVYKFFQDEGEINRQFAGIGQGEIVPTYKFLHDRIQQAACSLIAPEHREVTHLKIGRLLLENLSEIEQKEKIFDIVNQLNIAVKLIDGAGDRLQLSSLNLAAGKKAKESTAYAPAVSYLTVGQQLLPENSWETYYELTFEFSQELAECEYLCGNFEEAERLFDRILNQVKTSEEKGAVYNLRMILYTNLGRWNDVFNAGFTGLKLLGIDLPRSGEEGFTGAIEQQLSLAKTRASQIENPLVLAQNPEVENQGLKVSMNLLMNMISPAYVSNQELCTLLVAKLTNLSFASGNSPASAFGFVWFGWLGMIADWLPEGYKSGQEYAQLAIQLNEKFHQVSLNCKLYLLSGLVDTWRRHMNSSIDYLLKSFQQGVDGGDLVWAGYTAHHLFTRRIIAEQNLSNIVDECRQQMAFLSRTKDETMYDLQNLLLHSVYNLQGLTRDRLSFSDAEFDAQSCVANWEKLGFTYGKVLYNLYQLQILYTYENFDAAVQVARETEDLLVYVRGQVTEEEFSFYYCLSAIALFANSPEAAREILDRHVPKLEIWANNCPENFLHKHLLVQAEIKRVLGQKWEAVEMYDRAIAAAQKHQFVRDLALANELCAKFWLDCNNSKVAQTYLMAAYYGYARWGAKAKVDDLETCYADLIHPYLHRETISFNDRETLIESIEWTGTIGTTNNSTSNKLDVASIIKASQVLSGEIHLDKLLATLMQVVMENAGADKVALVLREAKNWTIAAVVNTDNEGDRDVPQSPIDYVKRTGATVMIPDLAAETKWIADAYFATHHPRSILCAPVVNRGELTGVIYLENHLTNNAFTAERVEVLNILCSQAAISLENALLYNTLEQKVADRTRELSQTLDRLKSTQKQLVEAEKMAALGSLVAGVAHEINTPVGTSITAASTLADETREFVGAIGQGNLKRSTLQNYTELASESTALILSNLQRAGEPIKSFKQVAVDQIGLEKRQFAVKAYLEELGISLAPNLKESNCILTVAGDETVIIDSYPGALAQIITNLIVNSIGHAYPNGGEGQLHLNVKRETADLLVITYQDDGCGIPGENLPKIFDPFFTTARNRGGSGLGLHIVYNLVRQKLQGSIEVQSEVNSGTVFAIALPIPCF